MRSYTLVETLAVVALVTLGIALATPLLLRPGRNARLDAACAAMLDLDARARLLAQGRGGAVLNRVGDEWVIAPRRAQDRDAPGARWAPPPGVAVHLFDTAGKDMQPFVYDASGRSADASLSVSADGATRVHAISGLTGWVEEVGP